MMFQKNEKTDLGEQKSKWIRLMAVCAVFLIWESFGAAGKSTWIALMSVTAGRRLLEMPILVIIVRVIRIFSILGVFVFVRMEKKRFAIRCAWINIIISFIGFFEIMYCKIAGGLLPIIVLLFYLLYVGGAVLLLVFAQGERKKHQKVLLQTFLVLGILSICLSVILFVFRFAMPHWGLKNITFMGLHFWKQVGIKGLLSGEYMREFYAYGASTALVVWPFSRCLYFFAIFAGMKNGCPYPYVSRVKEPKREGTEAGSSYGYIGLGKHIVLLLVTFGIWHLIWIYRTTDFLNCVEGEIYRSPIKKLLLCMFVPFYSIYWIYKSAERIDKLAKQKGISSNLSTTCLILAIFIAFIPPILMQDKINAVVTAD